MAELDAILEKYTNPTTGTIHGASYIAVDRNGNYLYRKAFGSKNVDAASPPLTLDTVAWIASQTKLTSSVSVMQLVERGLIGLDDDVRDVLPVLKDIQVLKGFEDGPEGPGTGAPILEDVQGPIKLRHMLSHSSGFSYDLFNPLLVKYSERVGRKENMFSGTIEGYLTPLVFQPGTSWTYGPGLDWSGQIIEKLTGMDYNTYQQENIWKPLGAAHTTFFPAQHGLTLDDIQETGERVEGVGRQSLKPSQPAWKFACRDALGGAGLFSTANDYSKLLAALLSGGGPLLKEESVNLLFQPQLSPQANADMRKAISGTGPANSKYWLWSDGPEHWNDYMEIKHCLCGLINSDDVPGRRRKNTVNWDGLPNLLWFIDRESGVAATGFTQIMPTDDAEARKLFRELEEALYRIVNKT